jgi:hypothetical protein
VGFWGWSIRGNWRREREAKRDQAWAAFFYRSNWTQEQLAKKEGKGQQWISRRLLFGRFLAFTPMGVSGENASTLPTNLTERRFRSYWERTAGGNERARFNAVVGQSDSHRHSMNVTDRILLNVSEAGLDSKGNGDLQRWLIILDRFRCPACRLRSASGCASELRLS